MRKTLFATAIVLACGAANASLDVYTVKLYGSNEVGAGDTDGWGGGSVIIDNVADTVTWALLAFNIDLPLTGAHIHAAPAGVNGGVIINFSGTLMGGPLFDVDTNSITPATAANFYVNLHNAAFTGGAIRGQLEFCETINPPVPEPETYAMFGAGLLGIGMMMRRRRRQQA